MTLSKQSKIRISFFAAAFVISAALRFVLMSKDYSMGIGNVTRGMIVFAWALTLLERITDKTQKKLLIGIALSVALMNFAQYAKYSCNTIFFSEYPDLWRFFVCLYYTPFIFQPLFTFLVAKCAGNFDGKAVVKKYSGLFVPCSVFFLLLLTNNFNHLYAVFTSKENSYDANIDHGIAYWLMLSWLAILTVLFFVEIIKASSALKVGKRIIIPLVPIILGVIYYVCYALDLKLKINGVQIVDFAFMYNIMVIGGLEGCILNGMIPSNSNYKNLFENSRFNVLITDKNKNPVFYSKGSEIVTTEIMEKLGAESITENGNRFSVTELYGGLLYRADNVSYIEKINAEISGTNGIIASRNNYLKTENEVKARKAHIEAMDTLYDRIAEIVRPQTIKVNTLLADEKNFKENLPVICFMNAYIKRRSNLELIGNEQDAVSTGELFACVSESIDYIKLCGINAVAFPVKSYKKNIEQIKSCYEFFGDITESVIDSLSSISVAVDADDDSISIRIMTVGAVPTVKEKYGDYAEQLTEDKDCITVFTLKGGDAV